MADPDAKTAARATRKPGPKRPRVRRRTSGDLEALRREVWFALRRVGDVLDNPDADAGDVCRAANALAALANSYRGVTEAAELVPRLEAIEAAQAQGGNA